MKRISMILVLAITLLFAAACGGGSDAKTVAGTNCDTAGEFGCDNNFVVKCNDNIWQQVRQCRAGWTCNPEKGTCDSPDGSSDGGADTGDTASDTGDTAADTGDTSADTGDTGNNGGNNGGNGGNNGGSTTKSDCKEYGNCLNSCVYGDPSYDSCRQECYNNTTPQGRVDYEDLYYCAKDNGCLALMSSDDAAYTECMTTNCPDEATKCDMLNGSGTEADTRYNSPYGHLTLNFSVDQIATQADQDAQNQAAQQQQESDNKTGQVTYAYASGTYGNSGTAKVIPDNAATDKIYSSAAYRQENMDDNDPKNDFEGVAISQTYAYQTGVDNNNNPTYEQGNPAVLLKIRKEAFAAGSIDISPFNNTKVWIQVVEMDWSVNPAKLVCVHATGEGTLNITTATGDIANHGALAFTGEADIYSPRNIKGYSYDQDGDSCEPVN